MPFKTILYTILILVSFHGLSKNSPSKLDTLKSSHVISCPSIEDMNKAKQNGWTVIEKSHDLSMNFHKKRKYGFAKVLNKKNKSHNKVYYKLICIKVTELKIYKAFMIKEFKTDKRCLYDVKKDLFTCFE